MKIAMLAQSCSSYLSKNKTKYIMSVEGGAFRCDVHLDKEGNSFTTKSLEDWNNHCTTAIEPPHEEEGNFTCNTCGDTYHAKLPFHKLAPDGSKGIALYL